MRTEQQEPAFEIYNVEALEPISEQSVKHGPLFPNSIRSIICGPSNCGKSNVMMSLLYSPEGLKYENVYVYSKSLHQPKYQTLKSVLNSISEVGYHTFQDNVDIMSPSESKANSVFIFDDVSCDKQNKIRDFFSMGRHNGIDSFLLIQSYARAPKQMVRDNANFLILFEQDDRNLEHVYKDHVRSDMKFETFKNMCLGCWKDEYGFLTLNKDSEMNGGRYRQGLDRYIYDV